MTIEQLFDKHSYMQVDTNRYLRLIGELDQLQVGLTAALREKRRNLLENLTGPTTRAAIQPQLREVASLETQIAHLSEEKLAVTEQLEQLISEAQTEAERELRRMTGEVRKEDQFRRKKKVERKRPQFENVSEWFYSDSEPKFCHCENPAMGAMIKCDSHYCERQWYHIDCLDEKGGFPETWYCRDCKKFKESHRSGLYKLYF